MMDILQGDSGNVAFYTAGGFGAVWVIKKVCEYAFNELIHFKAGFAVKDGMDAKTEMVEEYKTQNADLIIQNNALISQNAKYRVFSYHVLKHINTCSNCPERESERDKLELELKEIEIV